MTPPAPESAPARPPGRRPPGAGYVFLICGLSFLGAGLANRQPAFLAMGPAFLTLGIALLARQRGADRSTH